MAHGDFMNNGEPNPEMLPLWESAGQGDAFLPRRPLTPVDHVNGHEEPNQIARPISPLQHVAENEDTYQIPRSMLTLQHLAEHEVFLLYDYYDTDYSDSGDSDMEDDEILQDEDRVGDNEGANSDDLGDQEEQENILPGGSKKRAREEDEEQEERCTKRLMNDIECVLNKAQNQPSVGATVVEVYTVNKNPAEEQEEEKILPGGSKKRAKERNEEQEERATKRLTYNFGCVMYKTQNQPAIDAEVLEEYTVDKNSTAQEQEEEKTLPGVSKKRARVEDDNTPESS